MTRRDELELAIEAAIEAGGGPVVDEAIALLDQLDGDADVEDGDPCEGEGAVRALPGGADYLVLDSDDEPSAQVPTGSGALDLYPGVPVFDQCPHCGHLEFTGERV